MEQIFNWLRITQPFLELAYTAALLVNPSAAAEIRTAIDALKRASDTPDRFTIARGIAQVRAFGDNVIDALQHLATATVPNTTERQRQADDLVHSLSDSTKVWQAKKGTDAALLADYKTRATALAATVK